MGKGIAKSSIPPVQKVGIIIAGGIVGGVIHTIASSINHNNIQSNISSSTKHYIPSSNNNNSNNLLDFGNNISPLEILLQSINILSYIYLFLVFVLILQLMYKYYISDKPELNWLKYIFSTSNYEKIRILIYKVIRLNKNINIIYSILAFIILIVALFTISYTSFELINNLDKYINVYIEHYKK